MMLDKEMTSFKIQKYSLSWVVMFSPVLVGLLLMVPRLVSPQFGLFDDGTTILNARAIVAGTWNPGVEAVTGRYRPVYWLYYALIYRFAGERPFFFFLANAALLAVTIVGLIYLVRLAGGSRLHAWISGMFFAFSGPVVENYYTLSKSEALQVLFLVFSVISICYFVRWRGAWKKAVAFPSVNADAGVGCSNERDYPDHDPHQPGLAADGLVF